MVPGTDTLDNNLVAFGISNHCGPRVAVNHTGRVSDSPVPEPNVACIHRTAAGLPEDARVVGAKRKTLKEVGRNP